MFGHQLKFVADVLEAKRRPLDAGSVTKKSQARVELAAQYTKVIMQVVVSLTVLVCAFWLLLASGSTEAIQKLASGRIGTVLGYWLR